MTTLFAEQMILRGERLVKEAKAIAGPRFHAVEFGVGADYFKDVFLVGHQAAYAAKVALLGPQELEEIDVASFLEEEGRKAGGRVKRAAYSASALKTRTLKLRAARQRFAKKAVVLAQLLLKSVRGMKRIDAELLRAKAEAPFRPPYGPSFDNMRKQLQEFLKEARPVAEASVPQKLPSERSDF
jgi:hypothetical protein